MERDLYAKVTGLSAATFTVLNKADQHDEASLSEAAEFTRRVLAEASTGPGGPGRVYALSARAALNSGDPGFDAFAADFRAYLASRRVADLRSSAVMHGRRIARSLLDEVALTQRAAQRSPRPMPGAGSGGRSSRKDWPAPTPGWPRT